MLVAVVPLPEAEDRLAHLLAEPGHRLDLTLARPLDLADQPGRLDPRQLGRGRRVQVDRHVGLPLQIGGRDIGIDRALDRTLHDLRLVLTGGHQHDLASLQDRAHAHRDRLHRHVVFSEEIAGGVATRERVEKNEARARAGA